MGMSLAFHIVFAAIGISLPVLMVISEALYLRTGRPVFLELAKRWSRGAAILFAVGAVSGTVLSFELGLLWPGFMEKSGAIIGMPFSLEGFAFFTEAIFLGLYLMGWKRLPPLVHWFCGVLVILGGVTSGIFVVTANAWMNTPAGFKIVDGKITDIDPIAAMLNPAAAHEVLHMTLAAFIATGFAVAAIHAFFLLRDRRNAFHRNALGMALALACTSAPLQLISGDFSARSVAKLQPAKLAAMEALYQTQTGAPWRLGGIPDDESRTTRFALTIPRGLSLLVKSRSEQQDHRAGSISARRLAKRAPGALVVRSHDPLRTRIDRFVDCGWLARLETSRSSGWQMDPAHDRRGRAARVHRHRSRLDGDRTWPSALDHLWRDANTGSGYSDAKDCDSFRDLHAHLHLPFGGIAFSVAPSVYENRSAGFGTDQEKCLNSLSPVSCSWR